MEQKKILIAGDARIGNILELVVKKQAPGYETAIVEDGLDSLRKAEAWEPDVVFITGTRLSGLDGLALCEAIHSDPRLRGTRIILASGYETTTVAGSAFLAGASNYVPKPFELKEILRFIEECG